MLDTVPAEEEEEEEEQQQQQQQLQLETLILKDSSVRSIWTYLTASPCYTTNTNVHDYTTNRYKQYTKKKKKKNNNNNNHNNNGKTSDTLRERRGGGMKYCE